MKYLILIIFMCANSALYSQNLLDQDWVSILCNNGFIQAAKSVSVDSNQNIYVLGRFPNQTTCLIEEFYEEDGVYLLFKINSDGDEIWAKSIGSSFNFSSGGDMEINKDGDIILGFPFRGDFKLDQEIISTSDKSSSIILKIDTNGNLKWFKTFHASNISYVQDLHLDERDNIYTAISFFDSLEIEGEYLINKNYGSCISKLKSNGELEWYHHIHSEYSLSASKLDFMLTNNEEKEILIITGLLHGDSIFIDNEFIDVIKSKFNNQNFISTISSDGDIQGLKMLDHNIRKITSVSNFDERIYLSGIYTDTVSWLEYKTKATIPYSSFISELDINREITYFKELFQSPNIYVLDMVISNRYGFLMAGDFKGHFSCDIDSITLENEYRIGSFITNFNGELTQDKIRFVKGGTFSIVDIELNEDKIIAIANYEQNCSFDNLDIHAWNNDFLVFQTSEFDSLANFHPGNYSYPEIEEEIIGDTITGISIQVYPNPFNEQIIIRGISSDNLIIYNVSGIDITNKFEVTRNNDEIILEAGKIPSGMYFLSINDTKQIFKIIKISP